MWKTVGWPHEPFPRHLSVNDVPEFNLSISKVNWLGSGKPKTPSLLWIMFISGEEGRVEFL